MNSKEEEEEFDTADLLVYRQMTAREKLEYLERMNRFIQKITPPKAKELDEKLKREGF